MISTVKLLFQSISFEADCRSVKIFRAEFLTLKHPILLTYITYNNDNNQDELIINYNLLKNIVYESCTAYDKVFPPVTHFYRRSSSWPKSISSATATIFSFLIVLLPLKHSNADRKTIKATLHLFKNVCRSFSWKS